MLALHLRGDAFTAEEKAARLRLLRGPARCATRRCRRLQAVIAAEVGHLELAYDYCGEAALMDLQDLQHNTRDGLHIASLAGGWTVAVAGFGGMRDHDGRLTFAPRLPSAIRRLAFRVVYRGRCLSVAVEQERVTYRLNYGEPLEIGHHGRSVTVEQADLVLDVPPAPEVAPVHQPAGRAPARRSRPSSD